MATQLLRPGVLDQALRSGLFLSGVRRVGKTTFLKQDLIPALETDGAIVIYVDLWSDTSVSPTALLQRAVRAKLSAQELPAIALTEFARPEDAVRAHDAGFQMHLTTPADADELVSAVAQLTRRT